MASSTTAVATSRSSDKAPSIPANLVDEPLVLAFLVAALAYLLIAMLAGMLYSLQFLQSYPISEL